MRLLNVHTYQLESFLGTEKPPYAILSHTWEPNGEILFEDLQNGSLSELQPKPGFLKVFHTCERALRDGYTYVWIDTCCIDKSSSAELSEAINSMFKWYQQAEICYAFFSDVDSSMHARSHQSTLHRSRWFSRGWTLQELIAPHEVMLYDMHWKNMGSRSSCAVELSKITGIQEQVLFRDGEELESVLHGTSIAQRMQWASKRTTTREEDIAYCLLGLFDVNMPLLYGEGKKAFIRLQEAILTGSDDHSILAFRSDNLPTLSKDMFLNGFSPVLAPNVTYFRDDIRRDPQAPRPGRRFNYESGRLTLGVYLINLQIDNSTTRDWGRNAYTPTHVALLDSVCGDDYLSRPAILLRTKDESETLFKRCSSYAVLLKATSGWPSSLFIIGAETIISEMAVLSLNAISAGKSRTLITLEDEGPSAFRKLLYKPMTVDYSDLLKHCSVEHIVPSQGMKNHDMTVFDSIGIIAFRHKSNHFFVTCGGDPSRGAWCRIHTLAEMRSIIPMDKMFFEDDEAIEMVINYVKKHQGKVTALTDLLRQGPAKYDLHREGPAPTVNICGELTISPSYRTVEFVGRRLRVVTLIATPVAPQNSGTTKMPWRRKLHLHMKNTEPDG